MAGAWLPVVIDKRARDQRGLLAGHVSLTHARLSLASSDSVVSWREGDLASLPLRPLHRAALANAA